MNDNFKTNWRRFRAFVWIFMLIGCTNPILPPTEIRLERSDAIKEFPFLLRMRFEQQINFNPHTLSFANERGSSTVFIYLSKALGQCKEGEFYLGDGPTSRKLPTKGVIVIEEDRVTIDVMVATEKDRTTVWEKFLFNGSYQLIRGI